MKTMEKLPDRCRGSLVGALAVLTQLIGLHAAEAPARKPNIIFILTDDQGYGDLGRHGHPILKTPHLDRLFDESTRFNNFYVSPSCSPTRAALMTGMHEFRNGVTFTRSPRTDLFRGATTLPQLLKTAGYRTGVIGKWHLGSMAEGSGFDPRSRGFDWVSRTAGGGSPRYATGATGEDRRDSANRGQTRGLFDQTMERNGVKVPGNGFREDVFFNEAMTFIDESKNQPFFCYLATLSPHTPLEAPDEFTAPYRGKFSVVDEARADYLGMVANIDDNVGRLMKFLEERGLDRTTIVIFMNDNGSTWGTDIYNAHMRGTKCTIWQGGTRAISFWRWPDRWQPHSVEHLTAHLDVLPTLCEIAGVKLPAGLAAELEGFSLVPLLESKGPVTWHEDRMLFQHNGRWPSGTAAAHKYAQAAVRQGNYLLVSSRPCDDQECRKYLSQCSALRKVEKGMTMTNYTDARAQFHWATTRADRWSLFNIKKDPECNHDLYAEHPQLVSALLKAYDQWWDAVFPLMIARGGDRGDPNSSVEDLDVGFRPTPTGRFSW